MEFSPKRFFCGEHISSTRLQYIWSHKYLFKGHQAINESLVSQSLTRSYTFLYYILPFFGHRSRALIESPTCPAQWRSPATTRHRSKSWQTTSTPRPHGQTVIDLRSLIQFGLDVGSYDIFFGDCCMVCL